MRGTAAGPAPTAWPSGRRRPGPRRSRRHHAPAAGAADDHRLAGQRRVVEHLDRRVEGVHVDVEDRPRPCTPGAADGSGAGRPRRRASGRACRQGPALQPAEPVADAPPGHQHEGLDDDAAGHLRRAPLPVDELDGHLDDAPAAARRPGRPSRSGSRSRRPAPRSRSMRCEDLGPVGPEARRGVAHGAGRARCRRSGCPSATGPGGAHDQFGIEPPGHVAGADGQVGAVLDWPQTAPGGPAGRGRGRRPSRRGCRSPGSMALGEAGPVGAAQARLARPEQHVDLAQLGADRPWRCRRCRRGWRRRRPARRTSGAALRERRRTSAMFSASL